MRNKLSIFLVFILSAYLAGCSTMKTINIPQNPQELSKEVKVGDHIKVTTTENKTLSFKVTKVDKHAIHGPNQKVPYKHVLHIEKKTLDKRSVAVGTGGVVAGLAIATAVILSTCVVLT